LSGWKFPQEQKHLKELVVAYRSNIAIDFLYKEQTEKNEWLNDKLNIKEESILENSLAYHKNRHYR
jgi:hypothetical protein